VFAATDDETVNRRIASEARALGIMVQQVDSPDSSDFTFPATLRRGDLTVSFATNGAIPALSAHLKQEAADRFGEGYADFCRLARAFRRDAIQEFSPRMKEDFLRRLLDSDVLDLLSRGEKKAAYQRANSILVEFRSGSRHETTGVFSPREPLGVDRLGKVYLIGAGPGDPGLLTVKGAECLRSADTVLYDGMVDPILLDLYCAEAEQIDVSKRKGQCTRTQEEIIALLIERAQGGRTVARLKGGDPLVFARGGEEAMALHRARIPFEIVPGVSSVSAVPAYAGIPITDRDCASSFGVYSAHRKKGLEFSDEDWGRIAKGPDTLIFLMGRTRCQMLVEKLLEFGRPPSTPIAVICRGTTSTQRRVVGNLETISNQMEVFDLSGPTLIIVGEVVKLIPEMDWFNGWSAQPERVALVKGLAIDRIEQHSLKPSREPQQTRQAGTGVAFGHGGNLRQLARDASRPEEEIVDFSVNINPLGPPEWLDSLISSHLGSIVRYPDPACASLVEAIETRYGVNEEEVVVGNGSTEILYLLPQAVEASRAVIPVPAYIDYRRAAERARLGVNAVPMREADGFALDLKALDSQLEGGELVFMGQPNNPTGLTFDVEEFRSLALKRPSTCFVVDEAFGDFVDGLDSLTCHRPFNVIVLCSFTKLYAVPGLRLGCAMADREIAARLRELVPPWSVNALAQVFGTAALHDTGYADRTRELVQQQREFLSGELQSYSGITPFRSQANFLLIRIDRSDLDAPTLAQRMLHDGIAIRVCDNYEGLDRRFFRVAVRPDKEILEFCRSLRTILGITETRRDELSPSESRPAKAAGARAEGITVN
jgi:L-threonine-O-3-phosphate decarboxylase